MSKAFSKVLVMTLMLVAFVGQAFAYSAMPCEMSSGSHESHMNMNMNMNMNMDCQFNLFQIAKVPIERHVKIRSEATPFDPLYQEYLAKRKAKRQCRNSWNEPNLAAL